jgi:hypothetical protein
VRAGGARALRQSACARKRSAVSGTFTLAVIGVSWSALRPDRRRRECTRA